MVETSSQPNPPNRVTATAAASLVASAGNAAAIFAPTNFLGNMFLGEGFKPVYKTRGVNTAGATPSTSAGSLFTIDSILAPRPKQASPQRPNVLHHPTLHLGHIAAAASGFSPASADFLGEFFTFFRSTFIRPVNSVQIPKQFSWPQSKICFAA